MILSSLLQSYCKRCKDIHNAYSLTNFKNSKISNVRLILRIKKP